MNYKTHVAGGLALGYSTLYYIDKLHYKINDNIMDKDTYIIVTVGFIIGSLILDIEHKNSYVSNKYKIISFISRIFLKHRGFTHSIFGVSFITLITYLSTGYLGVENRITTLLSASIFIGAISHVFLDMFTPSGVELLNPFTNKRFSFIRGKVGIPDSIAFLICISIFYWSLTVL
ncbi:metal-dependent hydrolase [Tissierella carlieri]|uniref:Metal-dependent hydrolase n=1 Tax=Tissierella carlieri TaxID=689904 RepID=A0ABT1SF20_9FIRM|nr:metal-dependent hydrolase [Tissierella carlieri]MCQ4924967.1 metal-dependent hydrolase [Tissierella carlieri]